MGIMELLKIKKLILPIILIIPVVSCSSDSGKESTVEKITPSDTIFSYDSLTSVGF